MGFFTGMKCERNTCALMFSKGRDRPAKHCKKREGSEKEGLELRSRVPEHQEEKKKRLRKVRRTGTPQRINGGKLAMQSELKVFQ